MKRWKHNFKKGMACVLSIAMVTGLIPAMSGGAYTVQAADSTVGNAGKEPSVSAYATKEQMMDDTFAPNSDGVATNYGKLVFGTNSSDNPQEWYILGADSGVTEGTNNTIIFAASPIATGQEFSSGSDNKTYDYGAGTGYGESEGSIEVYPNHYGASELRRALQNMAADTSYFTTAEQNLMNDTTVTTKDTKNNVNYTTTDKLYALAADGKGYKTIRAGNNNTILAMSSYWSGSSGVWFRLRSPDDNSNSALIAGTGNKVIGGVNVRTGLTDLQPTSNLNLSSVLFASAATAASSDTAESDTITSGTAMTLRLNGTGKKIGTVTYNTTTGDIKAVRGNTSQAVALVVQGNDEINDWYYSKQITGTDIVNVSDIVAESNTPASIDLSACKIWLEFTDSTENLTYAVNAVAISNITSVAITDIDTPESNTALDTEASCATTGVNSTTPQITWTPSDTTAGYNTSYTASITLTADTFYAFADNVTATILGNSATNVTKNADGTLTVTYDFPATAKDKLTSITAPQPITVANGTAYDAMNLPVTVNIVTEGNTESSAPVTWNTTTPASGSYDPAVLTEQTVTLNGTVACPDSINANGVELTTTITITISAAGIVGAPTANPTSGTYTENQSVTLTSSTEGATIYYTTDGSEPTITGGVPGGTTAEYTAAIPVTGTEGQSVQTTIKAIAVKSGMQDSSVGTFTYTILLPVTEYTITATAGANGSITPSGAVGVAAGGSQTFMVSPSSGYVIDTLKVDGLEVTATTSYTFSDVNANHTIEVTFKQESQTPAVTAPSITTQPGNATVKVGETATFTITAGGTDLTYQWQIDRNDGNGWGNITNATATSYTTSTVDISCSGFKYRCAVSNSAGTVTSNTAVLTVTENTNPAPNPVDYQILDGANSDWKQNTDGTITIRGNGDFAKFVGVKVDGSTIDAKNYTAKEGSTIITLTADYLKTLSVGTHTFEILWTDGSASTSFTVSKNDSGNETPKDDDGNKDNNDEPNDNSNNNPATVPDDKNKDTNVSQTVDNQQITAPKTGDNNHLVMWVTLLGVSLAGLLSLLYTRKKKDNE